MKRVDALGRREIDDAEHSILSCLHIINHELMKKGGGGAVVSPAAQVERLEVCDPESSHETHWVL